MKTPLPNTDAANQARRARVEAALLADKFSVKEIAIDHGLTAGGCLNLIHRMGYQRMFVSDAERALIHQRRAPFVNHVINSAA